MGIVVQESLFAPVLDPPDENVTQTIVSRRKVDFRRFTPTLTGVGTELRMIHSTDPDVRGVSGEIRATGSILLAVQHAVGRSGYAQDPERAVAKVSITVGRKEHHSVDVVGVTVRISTGHRSTEGVAPDVPSVDVGMITNDCSSSSLAKNREVQGHFRDKNCHVRMLSER